MPETKKRLPPWWVFPQTCPADRLRPGMKIGEAKEIVGLAGVTVTRVEVSQVRVHFLLGKTEGSVGVEPSAMIDVVGSTVAPPSNVDLLAALQALAADGELPSTIGMEVIEELERRNLVERRPVLSLRGRIALKMIERKGKNLDDGR